MRVLWVKMGGLWPLNTGGRQRSFQLLRELSRRHQVVLVTTDGPDDEPAGLANSLDRCERIVSVPYHAPKQGSARFAATLARSWASRYPVDLWKWRSPEVRRLIAQFIRGGRFDVVVADFLAAIPNVPLQSGPPVVFFAHNVEHMIWRRLREVEPRHLRRQLLEVEWRKVRRIESDACHQARLTIAVSDEDRNILSALAPAARIVSIPTGVDVTYFKPDSAREQPHRLVFSGSMDWYPNEDAMFHFIEAILPRLRQVHPDLAVTVVGRNPRERLRAAAAAAGVDVTGTVNDVRPHIARGSVYVVPLRVGGGTRLKIFEALAMGKPVVSTTIGAEGLGLEHGRQLLLADTAEDFTHAVLSLLANADQRRALAREGRRIVQQRYAWPMVAQSFEAYLLEAATGETASAGTADARVAVS
jgi:glycosyltransferase involved in cell wall biosynthesis